MTNRRHALLAGLGLAAAPSEACALLAAASLVSLRVDTGARVFRWAARGAGA